MTPNLSRAIWHKSSRSAGTGGNCVEVANLDTVIAVRDSKAPHNGTLVFDSVTRELGATLGRHWRFRSHEVTLSPGTYRWYVWPIPQNARRPLGPLLKASWFRVVSH